MCDASMVALGVKGMSSVMQGEAARAHGRAVKTIDGLNAEAANASAGQALQKGAFDELRATMHGDTVIADQAVMESGSGSDVNVGGNQATRRASEAVLDVTRHAIQVDAALTAYNLKTRAQGYYQAGDYAEKAGDAAFIGSFLGGIGDFTDLKLPEGSPPSAPDVATGSLGGF